MSVLVDDAERLLEAAGAATESEFSFGDVAILISRDGAVRTVDASGWLLETLQRDFGAETVYRISRCEGRIRVEGRSGRCSFRIERDPPSGNGAALLRPSLPVWLRAESERQIVPFSNAVLQKRVDRIDVFPKLLPPDCGLDWETGPVPRVRNS